MSPEVYSVFEEICAWPPTRGRVLEVGAVAGPDGLLRMASLREAKQRIGLNREETASGEGLEMIRGNANDMSCFADGFFDLVLCNSTLEHDAFFWKSLSEMHRVTAPGGLMVIGVPGFAGMGVRNFAPPRSLLGLVLRFFVRTHREDVLLAGTPTLGEHFFPGDYYRFTEQAVKEVFLAGLKDTGVRKVMNPPRFIGWGRKP